MTKMKLYIQQIFVLILCFTYLLTNAQSSGQNDNTFNPSDLGFNSGAGPNAYVATSIIQNDGKVIIGGNFINYNGRARAYIARINADGSVDNSFLNVTGGANSTILSLAIQSDGKIIIGGVFNVFNGTLINRIARLNTDGSLDATFLVGTGANGTVRSVVVQSDDKIIICGDFTNYKGTAINRIARLNTDGSLDATFNPGTGANNPILASALQPDGKVIIGGEFNSFNGTARNYIARLNTDGTIDAGFNPGTGANYFLNKIVIQADEKIVIVGQFTGYNGTSRSKIARVNADGSLDTSFNPGFGANAAVVAVGIQNDGKIIIGGFFSTYNGTASNKIARLNSDGSLDATLNIGAGANNAVRAISIQSDDKIIFGGDFTNYRGAPINYLARVNSDGILDNSFNPKTGASNVVRTSAVQGDDKIIIGGDFTDYNGTTRNYLARLNTDGTLDFSFNIGTGPTTFVNSIALQSDGKIIIGGNFTYYNGVSRNSIARLKSDGSLDDSFIVGTAANNTLNAIAIQSDGKIIVAGDFTSYNGTAINRIARLNSDGSLDGTFIVGTGANNTLNAIAIQSDGKIVIGGNFTSYNGTSINRIARLNTDGTIDGTFNAGTGANNPIFSICLQGDSKIIVCGELTSYNGAIIGHLARLNANGTLDVTFTTGTGSYGSIYLSTLQSDGKIIIGGSFSSYNGINRKNIARLNFNGTLDDSFIVGTGGADRFVKTIALQSDDRIIIGGEFTSYNNIGRNRIARIHPGCTPSIIIAPNVSHCAGVLTTYTAIPTNGGATPTYLWKLNGTIVSTTTTFVSTFTTGDQISCLLTSSLACASPTVATSNVATITVNALPNVSISGANTVCSGNTITLTGNGADTYTWESGSNTIDNSVSPTVNTTYFVTGLSTLTGCSNSAIHSVSIKLPTTSLTSHVAFANYLWNGTTYITSGAKTFLTTNAAGCDSVATLNLIITNVAGDINGDGIITSPEVAGDINGNGVLDPDELVSIKNNSLIVTHKVYPNPSVDYILVETANNNEPAEISMYNTFGQLVYTEKTTNNKTKISVDDKFKQGVYIVKIMQGSINSQHRIVISK